MRIRSPIEKDKTGKRKNEEREKVMLGKKRVNVFQALFLRV